MKKISFILLGVVTMCLSACFDSEYEQHQTNFLPTQTREMMFYADQTYDSIKLFSYDPWTAGVDAQQPWFSINPSSGLARPGTPAITRIDVTMPQNTTGKNYTGRIVVKTYDDNMIMMPVHQCSWLNIMYPNPLYEGNNIIDRTARYELKLSAYEKESVISFHTYQENPTLTHVADWLTFEDTIKLGANQVTLNITPNPSKEDRYDTLTLTSGLISTPIYVVQKGKKEE